MTRKKGKYASIVDLYVKEEFRGQGHGTALLERAEAIAEREGCDFLRVSAEWENESAQRFYETRQYERKQLTYTKTVD